MTKTGLYLRISDDRLGEERGVARQETDCRRLAASLGWDILEAGVYRENDTSAFQRRTVTLPDGTKARRVVRPKFRRMLEDLADGTIDAVIGYDLDRVARDPRDLEDLIDVCEQTGRPARSVTGSLDLSTDAGITMARVAVAVANQSSRDTSRRVRRVKQDQIAAGRWLGGGKRAYGYTGDRTAIIPAEAEIVREAAARVLAGEGLGRITNDLRARGINGSLGRPFARNSLRGVLIRPVVAGLLTYRGEIVGKAPWPAILDEDTWRAVRAEIDSRPRQDTTLVHWLTGLAVCGLCGSRLRGNDGGYLCVASKGGCARIWVSQNHLERLITGLLTQRAAASPPPTVPTQAALVDDSQLAELAAMWGRQEISLAEYRAAREEVVKRLRAAAPERPRLPAWARSGDLEALWPTLDAMGRRTVAGAFIEAVVVRPSPDKRWTPNRVEVLWR